MSTTVRFQLWDHPSALDAAVEDVQVEGDQVEVVVLLPPTVWSQVDAFSLFNLDPEDWQARDRFDEDAPVRVRLRLDAGLSGELGGDPDAVLAELVRRDAEAPADPLLSPASWTALELTQDVELPEDLPEGTLRQGVRTAAGIGTPLLDAVTTFLEDEDVPYDITDEGVEVDGGDEGWVLVVRPREQADQIVVEARWPEVVPEDRRAEMMRAVTELNVELTVVWFELDLDAGRVSAQTGLTTRGLAVGPALVGALVHPCVAAFERFLPAIQAISAGEVDIDVLEVSDL
jgi:hypothetical protein